MNYFNNKKNFLFFEINLFVKYKNFNHIYCINFKKI